VPLIADRVVMASNAWTPEIGEPGHRLFPLEVVLFEAEPLTGAQIIGESARQPGLYYGVACDGNGVAQALTACGRSRSGARTGPLPGRCVAGSVLPP
jgi:hypothetical protein